MEATSTTYQHLAPNPKSSYKQLFLKGTRIRARTLYGCFMSDEEPMTVEEIAADWKLPIAAVEEAIRYCQSDPPEIREDFEREERLMEASGMNEPGYKYNPTPKPIPPEIRARILRGE